MKSPLEELSELEDVIRELHKIDSKMNVGQFIPAYRALHKLIAALDRRKIEMVKSGSTSRPIVIQDKDGDI